MRLDLISSLLRSSSLSRRLVRRLPLLAASLAATCLVAACFIALAPLAAD